jgi:type IV pilus assembly protein PilW
MVFTGTAKGMHDHGRSRERRLPELDSTRLRNPGFTLIEVLISLAIGMVVLAALYAVFTIQNKNFAKQDQIAEMQQIARTAMDSMAREITMAGYDPNKSLPTPAPANAAITAAGATSLSFTSDLNGDSDTVDANESVTYAFDGANYRITRNTGGGAQPFAENIQGLTFTYYDAAGAVTATTADIRRIQISITARTGKPDPAYSANNGYRTYTLTSFVTPRNLSM